MPHDVHPDRQLNVREDPQQGAAAEPPPEPAMPRAALITGGARRIGAALARDLAARGWAVAVHYRSSEGAAKALCREVGEAGGAAAALRADLRDEADLAGLVAAAQRTVGPLGLLINNASVFDYDDLATADRSSWQQHLETNLRAPFALTQAFAEALPSQARGLVVNMIDSRVWNLSPRYVSYTLSKSGLWTLTRTLAQALAPRIRVNGIGLGPTLPANGQSEADFAERCRRLPLARPPSLSEVSAALQFLLEARSVTGQMLALDGGDHLTTAVGAPDGAG